MTVFLLLALFGVLEVLGQATHNTVTFSYQACSNVDVSRACRCGDDPNAVHPIDESKCDFACMGDRNLGMCGSVCPDNSPKIANIYTRTITPLAASNSANGGISQYQRSQQRCLIRPSKPLKARFCHSLLP
ncbi:hypothetical protein ESCO_000105 [Escovopsis weberi]|uniref:Uncharacterized protein n=1 Tax=Escovopsis weberi TaxID=150374 RepID=A0A0M8N3G2_ESCWE|nr:hypothetical protein ESCO_000105 [Escovopsis weberi]